MDRYACRATIHGVGKRHNLATKQQDYTVYSLQHQALSKKGPFLSPLLYRSLSVPPPLQWGQNSPTSDGPHDNPRRKTGGIHMWELE